MSTTDTSALTAFLTRVATLTGDDIDALATAWRSTKISAATQVDAAQKALLAALRERDDLRQAQAAAKSSTPSTDQPFAVRQVADQAIRWAALATAAGQHDSVLLSAWNALADAQNPTP